MEKSIPGFVFQPDPRNLTTIFIIFSQYQNTKKKLLYYLHLFSKKYKNIEFYKLNLLIYQIDL